MNQTAESMLDLLPDRVWEELGPVDPNWFDILTTHPQPVIDPDELCANQEGNFKIPFNNSAVESQLFSTPKVFRRAQLSSTEDESQSGAEAGDPVAKYGANVQLQTQDTFNVLQISQQLETSKTKYICESLGLNVQADISWTSSFNTPPAVPSTLILSNPKESPRPMSLSDEKDVVIVRKLFPSLSNSSQIGPLSPPEAPVGRGPETADLVQNSFCSPEIYMDHSYCDSKQAQVVDKVEGFRIIRKVKTEKVKRSLIDSTDSQELINTFAEVQTSKNDIFPKQTDQVPDSKSPLKSQDEITQWSPLCLSGIQVIVEETRHNPGTTTPEENKLTDKRNESAVEKLSPSLNFNGSSKKKRTFVYTVKPQPTQVEENLAPTLKQNSSHGQDFGANPTVTLRDKPTPKTDSISKGSDETLPPEPIVEDNPPLSANIQDFDMSQLNRAFAQDFSQILSINNHHIPAGESTRSAFSPSVCLSALRLAKQKVGQANLSDCYVGPTPISRENLNYSTIERSNIDSGFQSISTDVSLVTNVLSAEDSRSKMVSFQSNINGEDSFLGDAMLTSNSQKSEDGSKSEAANNCRNVISNPISHKSGSLCSHPASGFKTASNTGILISSENLEKAKHLFVEAEGELSQPKTRSLDLNVSKIQSSIIPEVSVSHHLDQDVNFQLTSSQKADVTELCSLLEEAESQFEFTQFKTAKIKPPCEGTGVSTEVVDKSNDADFLSGIDFDDSFSSEQANEITFIHGAKIIPCVGSNIVSHPSTFESKESPLNTSNRTSGEETTQVSKKCLSKAKDISEDLKEENVSHPNLANKECEVKDEPLYNGDVLNNGKQYVYPPKEVDKLRKNGLQTASGRGITISEKHQAGFSTLKTSQQVELVKSKEAISHGDKLSNAPQNSANLSRSCYLMSIGFSKASGSKIQVSVAAISQAKRLLDEDQTHDNINEPECWRTRHTSQTSATGSSLRVEKTKVGLLKDCSAKNVNTLKVCDPTKGFVVDGCKEENFSTPNISQYIGSVTKNSDISTHHNVEKCVDSAATPDKNLETTNHLLKDSNDFPATEMDGIDEFFTDSEVMDVMDCVSVKNERCNNVDEKAPMLNKNSFDGLIDERRELQSNSILKPSGCLDNGGEWEGPSLNSEIETTFSDDAILAAVSPYQEKIEFRETNDDTDNTLQCGGFKKASGKSVTVSSVALQKAKSLLNDLGGIEEKLNGPYNRAGTALPERPSTSRMSTDLSAGGFCTASGMNVTISEDAMTKAKSFLNEICDEGTSKHVEEKMTQQKHGVTNKGVTQEQPIFRKPLSPPSCRSAVSAAGFATASGKKVTVSDKAMAKAKSLLSETPCLNIDFPLMENCSVPGGGFQTAGGKGVTFSPSAMKKAKSLFDDCDNEANRASAKDSTSTESMSVLNSAVVKCKGDIPLQGGFQSASGRGVSVSTAALRKAKSLFESCDDETHRERTQDCGGLTKNKTAVRKVSNSAMFKSSGLLDEGKDKQMEFKDNPLQGGFQTASGRGVSVSTCALKKAKSLFHECEDNDGSFTQNVNVHGFKAASGKQVGFSTKALQKAKALFDDISLQNATVVVEEKPVSVVSKTEHDNSAGKSDTIYSNGDASNHQVPTKDPLTPLSLTKKARTDGTSCVGSNMLTGEMVSLNLKGCSETQQGFVAQEALDCTKALLMDESDVEFSMEKMLLQEENPSEAVLEEKRLKRKFSEEQDLADAQPPSKRRLLEEFDRSVDATRGFELCPEKHNPNEMLKDRRVLFQPYITEPERDGKNYSETKLHNSSMLDIKSNSVASFIPLISKSAKKDVERNSISTPSIHKFVPPFKKQSVQVSREAAGAHSDTPFKMKPAGKMEKESGGAEKAIDRINYSVENNSATDHADMSQTLENVELAQNMQEMRIRKKRRQTIRPQPGSLFLTRTSVSPRISWKSAARGNAPARYNGHQLYQYGVAPHVAEISSDTAESFLFDLQYFLKSEAFEDDGGVQLADGGWLIPCKNGTAGKNEFYRAMCDTPGVDPKLLSEEWVYNHYRWVVWKLASMERSFPQQMGSTCLTPEQVLLQLKFRYDVEVDNSRRPALRKIMEKDDTSAKTLVLCVCGVASRGRSPSKQIETKAPQDTDSNPCAVVWLTDGWYSIKAQLDGPLTSLLCRGRLAVGAKLIINGAQVTGSQEACSPLEAPESLMFKISANSVRLARWDVKLGFYKDPRPFVLPLSSLFHNGGAVGCVDIVVLRVYPLQWMERKPHGGVVFRSARTEEREARRYNAHKQKTMEILFAKIQADFENEERAKSKRNPQRRTRSITRRDIEKLQDGEELYEALGDDHEGRLSSKQMEALHSYKSSLMEKKQAELQDKYRRAVEESDKGEGGCPKRDVTPVWRISVADFVDPTGQVYQLNFWRPSSDLQSSLKEGSRYKVYNLTTSEGKKRVGFASVQLTNTKKTQIQEVQTPQHLLSSCFEPRVCVRFADLQDPEFRSSCGEVDLSGKVVSVVQAQGPSPAFYLADSDLSFVKVRCFSSLAESGLAELVKPGVLLALSNLQLRGQSNVPTPVVFSGDLTVFSTNPKESHLRESIERMQGHIQDDFLLKAEDKLSSLIDGPSYFASPALPSRNPASHTEVRPGMACPLSVRNLGPVTPVSQTPATVGSSNEKDPRSLKRRRALDYLSRIPSPPLLFHLNSLSSPCVKKTFNPPRKSSTPSTSKTLHAGVGPEEDEWVDDAELAMIDTQALHAL